MTSSSPTSPTTPTRRVDRRRGRRAAALAAALSTLVVALLLPGSATAAPADAPSRTHPAGSRPSTYVVSEEPGVLPEGIGFAPDRRTFYVTSSGTGAVYRGDVRKERMQVFAPAGDAGRTSAAGVHVDRRGRVFVAGRTALDVYDAAGGVVAHRSAPSDLGEEPFLNDLAITRDAVYVTDSANAVVYRAALDGPAVGPLRLWFNARTVEPDFPVYYWYLNGIVADPSGRVLLVAAQGLGALVRVDVPTATGSFVDTAGASLGADGLLLAGRRTLYAVLNYEPPADGVGLYRLRLSEDWTMATDLRRVPDRGLQDPTTVAIDDRRRLLVVNSQLEHAPGTPPYTVSALSDRR